MKDKILETEIRKHAEALSVALRKYTNEPLYLRLTLFTRDSQVTDDKEHVPDFCDLVCHAYDDTEEVDPIVSQAFLIHHGDDGISKTESFPFEVNRNDSKG